ncbi:magnetosome protein MamI-1 [Fundidesulfovibrio magnetotacticus]|uniref:Magnetosome protein MamI-1 n=1 Tax=Fundidesulfovibrio magnetotacticus TaxID=2730080 RepID=A0A6V8LHU4_9BACT|nr:hypothetical protein [Fundidesulfovibrio magnetotacticus]GFK92283.1 magnetosome protein MamI-1 [Fundidesulfovibrio magnetotacticus]
MVHIILGLLLMALGVWGLYDEYYYVVDFLKGSIPLALMAGGLLAALAGFVPVKQEEELCDE